MGTLSARPSDGTYHLHIVLVTELHTADVREAFHVAGLDAYIQSPRPNESAEGFAARKAAYAFDNAAHGPTARPPCAAVEKPLNGLRKAPAGHLRAGS